MAASGPDELNPAKEALGPRLAHNLEAAKRGAADQSGKTQRLAIADYTFLAGRVGSRLDRFFPLRYRGESQALCQAQRLATSETSGLP